jgi:WD40 repeat protein
MTDKPRDAKYYVVGGPVQPDRECYQQRYADAELYRRLSDGEYCHVLAQRQTGKTSLAASTARKLRAGETMVSMVDLTQASGEDPAENAGRWYYSIAYRIVRELRIRVDIQTWWQERSGLTNQQRLREFFLEIVLEETKKPVVIFLDRVDATRGQPFAQDLFGAIRACYDARVTDSVFQRLTFAMFGSGAASEIVKNVQGSPFEISVAIPLPDFSAQEMAGLMVGLGKPLPEAEEILKRVWTWTRGHPYLSQKIFRGLARRRADVISAEIVDELVNTQFLAPNSLREEPHLTAIAERLGREGSGRTARLNLYGRVRKGVDVNYDNASRPQRELVTAGVVSIGSGGVLRVRNEIYAMVFGMRWVNQSLPYGIKGIGIAAAIIAVLIALPVWYTEYLPRPYISALSTADQDYAVAEDAYQSLQFLPGYGATADRLFMDFLARSSASVSSLSDMRLIYARVAALPDGAQRANELLADFWERKAVAEMHIGNRDAALISLLEALQVPTEARRRLAAELVGQDYRNLAGTIRTRNKLKAIAADESSSLLTVLDQRNNVDVWRLDGERPRLVSSDVLIAEERLELEERRMIDGLTGVPQLLVKTNHTRPQQVMMYLRAPSGQQARLSLSAGQPLAEGVYAFDFGAFRQLRGLLAGEMAGNWSIAVSDLEQGVGGELLDWGLVPAGVRDIATDDFLAQPIPEPRLTENATAVLAGDGRLAMSWPLDQQTKGSILIWDLTTNEVLARIPRPDDFAGARFALGGERVITLESRQISVWETATGKNVGQIELDASSKALLSMSTNGRFIALRASLADGTPGVAVWDLSAVKRFGALVPAENVGPVAVESNGKYLAIGGRDPWVRVWSVADGGLQREFEHSSPLRSILFDATGNWLATDDLSSTFRVWSVADGGVPVLERLGSGAWRAQFSSDSSRLLFGASDRAYEIAYLPTARSAGVRLQHAVAANDSFAPGRQLAPVILGGSNVVVTSDADSGVKVWSVPGTPASLVARSKSLPGGTRAAISRDGKRIAVGTQSGEVRIFAVGAPGGILLGMDTEAEVPPTDPDVVYLRFSDDTALLASASMDGRVRVWNAGTGVARELLIAHPDGAAHDLVFAEQNRLLISASRREVIVTDLTSGEVIARQRIQANHPQLAVAEQTGVIFIADDLDGVTAWDWRVGEAWRVVEGENQIRNVAVSADGSKLVTASDKQLLIQWDLISGLQLENVVQAAGKVDDMWIVGDDNRLLLQAGPWLQTFKLFPTGLVASDTRLLAVAPAALQPAADGLSVTMLSASASRPTISNKVLDVPGAAQLEGAVEDLRQQWQARLSLMLDEDGLLAPSIDESAVLPEGS